MLASPPIVVVLPSGSDVDERDVAKGEAATAGNDVEPSNTPTTVEEDDLWALLGLDSVFKETIGATDDPQAAGAGTSQAAATGASGEDAGGLWEANRKNVV